MGRALMLVLLLAPMCTKAQVPDLSGYEYWFDQADEDNERQFVPFTTPGQAVVLTSEQLDAAGLSIGQHRLHVRLRDQDGRWSSTLFRSFLVYPAGPFQVVSGEYWFDQDDENRQPFALSPGGSVNITLNTPAEGLSVGQHRVHYRLRDDQGAWSSVLARHFVVSNEGPHELVLLRYWSDPQPNADDIQDMTTVPITPNVQYLDIIDDVLFCNWTSTGQTDVFFQLKDNRGQWSSVITDSYNIDAIATPPVLSGSIEGPIAPDFGTTATYTAPSSGTGASYVWSLPNSWTGSSTTNSITVEVGSTNDGSDLTVYAVNTCGESDPISLDIVTGITTISRSGEALLFPNPSSGLFQLALPDSTPISRIVVVNSAGQRVHEADNITTDRYILDLSGSANGLYTVLLTQGNQHVKLQVMVQR